MKKILFYLCGIYNGGTEIETLNLMKNLSKEGYELLYYYHDKQNSYDVMVQEYNHYANYIDIKNKVNVDTVIYSRDSAFEYLSKLDPNTYEKTLIILNGICDFELHYGEVFYGLINRIEDCENISIIGLCGNMFITSILETDYFPLRILFRTDNSEYSMATVGSDEGLWLEGSNFLMYNNSTREKILGLFQTSET